MATSRDTSQYPYLDLPGFNAQQETGPLVSAVNTAPDGYLPSTNGLLLANGSPARLASTNTVGAGIMNLQSLPVTNTTLVSKVWTQWAAAATSPTVGQCFFGIYGNVTAAGVANLLGASADQSTLFLSSAVCQGVSLTAQGTQSLLLPAGSTVWVATLFNGTTSPAFYRLGTPAIANVNQAAPNFVTSNFGAGQTALPATIALASMTTNTTQVWAALS